MKGSHGGDIWGASRGSGVSPGAIIDFSASVNPRASHKAEEAVKGALEEKINISSYPEPGSGELKKAISSFHGLGVENILPGNGSTELIYLMPRVFRPKTALIVEPAFSEYRTSLALSGCKVFEHLLGEEEGFAPELKRLKAALEKTLPEVLYISNPSNPTGVLLEKNFMIELIGASETLGIITVVDEAFMDFCEADSVKKETPGFEGLVVLRSMTKFFSLAGLRLGYAIAHAHVIERLSEHMPPWSVNAFARAAGIGALSDRPYIEETRRWFATEREFLQDSLNEIRGLKVFPAAANFFMIKILEPSITAPTLKAGLLEKGLLIRDLSDFRGLGPEYFRIAVRERTDNTALVENLKRIFTKKPLQASPVV